MSPAGLNFALLELPARLPRGLRALPAEIRPEGPPFREKPALYGGKPWGWCGARTTSHRQILSGGGRVLRIKQYLYD
ncbi:MAG TPA: hypothetical protein VNI01_09550, partial [Elusimicrobiota bacterium]|nr:hypothetical protein [Elusimicrobiota bacterium]